MSLYKKQRTHCTLLNKHITTNKRLYHQTWLSSHFSHETNYYIKSNHRIRLDPVGICAHVLNVSESERDGLRQ